MTRNEQLERRNLYRMTIMMDGWMAFFELKRSGRKNCMSRDISCAVGAAAN